MAPSRYCYPFLLLLLLHENTTLTKSFACLSVYEDGITRTNREPGSVGVCIFITITETKKIQQKMDNNDRKNMCVGELGKNELVEQKLLNT